MVIIVEDFYAHLVEIEGFCLAVNNLSHDVHFEILKIIGTYQIYL